MDLEKIAPHVASMPGTPQPSHKESSQEIHLGGIYTRKETFNWQVIFMTDYSTLRNEEYLLAITNPVKIEFTDNVAPIAIKGQAERGSRLELTPSAKQALRAIRVPGWSEHDCNQVAEKRFFS